MGLAVSRKRVANFSRQKLKWKLLIVSRNKRQTSVEFFLTKIYHLEKVNIACCNFTCLDSWLMDPI